MRNIITKDADALIAEKWTINWVLINVSSFDWYESFSAFLSHIKFIKNHQEFVKKLAIIWDETWEKILPKLVNIFVHPELKRFSIENENKAIEWLKS